MKHILSIQSHVAFGHVGNSAAVFPLQRLGFEVIPINTVQFSNHTGYGAWTGQVFSAEHIAEILNGLAARGVLNKVDALLTGYLGDAAIGQIIIETLEQLQPEAFWLCDPVMGDVGRGMFVREAIPAFFRETALPRAKIITPNQFELEYLSGMKIKTMGDVLTACDKLHAIGPARILVTSLEQETTPEGSIQMMLSEKTGARFLVTTPRLPLDPAPNGAGDCTAALLLGNLLAGYESETALSRTAGSIFELFQQTQQSGQRELALIATQNAFFNPPPMDVTRL